MKRKKNPAKAVNFFLDSGAFSAWTQGKDINLMEYVSFIRKHLPYIGIYSNLDVIGDASKTWYNQIIMEEHGLHPIPVYHYGEDEKWLIRYLERGYEYISLGGMVPITTSNLFGWLDRIWDKYLIDPETRMPKIKVHGFGLTSLPLILKYPWYSVDSTSWVMTGRMGSVFIPKMKNGKYLYNANPEKVGFSNQSPKRKLRDQHYSSASPWKQKYYKHYLQEKGYEIGESEFKKVDPGYKLQENERWFERDKSKSKYVVEIIIVPGVSNTYQFRDELNIDYFLRLQETIPEWPWQLPEVQQGFF